MHVIDRYPNPTTPLTPEDAAFVAKPGFKLVLRETIAWRVGRQHHPVWRAADELIERGVFNVAFEIDPDRKGVTFGHITLQEPLALYGRCVGCNEILRSDPSRWRHREPDICVRCATAKSYQSKSICCSCGNRGVANNGRYCLACVIDGKREVLDFLSAISVENRTGWAPQEFDIDSYDDSAVPIDNPVKVERIKALANERNAWGGLFRRCAPEDRSFAGDWAFQPLYSKSTRWIVVKWERIDGPEAQIRYFEQNPWDKRNPPTWEPVSYIELPGKAEFCVYVAEAWETAKAWAAEHRRLTADNPEVWGDALMPELLLPGDRLAGLQDRIAKERDGGRKTPVLRSE